MLFAVLTVWKWVICVEVDGWVCSLGSVSAAGHSDKGSSAYKGCLNFLRGAKTTVGEDPGVESPRSENHGCGRRQGEVRGGQGPLCSQRCHVCPALGPCQHTGQFTYLTRYLPSCPGPRACGLEALAASCTVLGTQGEAQQAPAGCVNGRALSRVNQGRLEASAAAAAVK